MRSVRRRPAIDLAPSSGGTSTKLLAAGSYKGVLGISRDDHWLVTYKAAASNGATDAYLASAIAAGSATTLVTTTPAIVPTGDLFTADSSHAVFSVAPVTSDGTSTSRSGPHTARAGHKPTRCEPPACGASECCFRRAACLPL